MRYPALEALRGLAALMVVAVHVPFAVAGARSSLLANGVLMVDFFFILSGFVITHAYRDRIAAGMAFGQYLVLRVGRLAPLNAFVLLLWVPFFLWRRSTGLVDPALTDDYALDGFARQFFLLDNLRLGEVLYWNFPAWSVGVEVAAYLVFFAAVRLTAGGLGVARALAVSAICYAALLAGDPQTAVHGNYLAFPRCFGGFFLGVVLYHLHEARARRAPFGAGAELGALALFLVVFTRTLDQGWSQVAAILSLAPVVFVFADARGPVGRVLLSPALQFLGRISFSVYLVHALVVFAIRDVFILTRFAPRLPDLDPAFFHDKLTVYGSLPVVLAMYGLSFAAVIGVATVLHSAYEEPMRALSRRLARGPRLFPA